MWTFENTDYVHVIEYNPGLVAVKYREQWAP